MARTLNSSRPIGSFGSWSDPPMFSFPSVAVSSSTMSRDLASGRWAERNHEILDLDVAELGARLLIA